MKSRILSIILAIAMLAGGMAANVQPVQAAVTINNGGFENGMSGWVVQAEAPASATAKTSFTESGNIYTILPYEGSKFALLKPSFNGVFTIISQPFSAVAGDWVSGVVNFGSEDYLRYNDTGMVRILDTNGHEVAVPFTATALILGGIRKTGWVQWGYQFTAEGTYSVEASVANMGDDYRNSVLCLDNVSNAPISAPFSLTLPVLPSGSGSVVARDADNNILTATNGVISNLAANSVVKLSATAAPGYVFSGWAGSVSDTSSTVSVTMNADKTVIASFIVLNYTLSWSTSGTGTVTGTANGVSVSSGASVAYGSAISLSAAPANGWSFQGWTGSVTSTSQTINDYITSNYSVVANFVQSNYSLTINKSGTGSGEVNLSNSGPTYHYGDVVQLTAAPALGSYFGGWGGALNGNTNPATIPIYGSYTISAEFIKIPDSQYIINTTTIGQGSILITDPSGKPITNGSSVVQGTVLTFTPQPAAGWTFSAWSGDVTGNTSPASVTMDANKSVTATFTQNVYNLTIIFDGEGSGNVLKNNPGPYHYGDVVQLTAQPDATSLFSGWGEMLSGTANPTNITISDDMLVSASFSPKPDTQVTLTVVVTGSGSVTKNPDQPSYTYNPAQGAGFVTLIAVPAQGWTFSGWGGNASGSTLSYSIIMDANKTVTATFVQNISNSYTVTISSSGNGTAGINQNGTIVTSGTYTSGTQISLVATPATGYKFSSWSGGASGTTSPLSVTVNGNLNITASFAVLTFTLALNSSGHGSIQGGVNPVYNYGSSVLLTPVPETGWVFSNWSGDATGNTNPLTIIMNSNKSITAVFSQFNPNPYTITVHTSGNGSVTLNPNTTGYASGAAVTIQAVPSAGSVFTRWSGNALGSQNPTIVTVTGNLDITANFTGISLSSTPNPSVYGQNISLTAAVTTDATLGVAGGTFQLTVDGSNSGSPVALTNGSAALSLNGLSVATHTLGVSYSGDGKYSAGTSQIVSQVVDKANTTTSINSTNNGLNYAFTATVIPVAPGAGTLSGNVVFSIGSSVLDTQPLVAGQAVSNIKLPSGGVSVTATYSGDTNFNSSSAFFVVPAIKVESSLVLTANPNPSNLGDTVTFTATVSGAGAVPTGSVVFSEAGTTLDTETLDAAGEAQLTLSTLSVGTHAVNAQYDGNTLYNSSQAGVSQVVILNTSITLSVDTNLSVFGQEITFTANTSGIAAGQTLTIKDGAAVLGSSSTLDVSGSAIYRVSNLSVGTHNITAVYSQTVSNTLAQTVNKADTAVTLSGTPGSGNFIFAASVSSLLPGTGIPAGTVTFLDGSAPLGSAVPLGATGQASLTWTLSAGEHSITAQYNGNANYNTSGSDPLAETVRTSSIQMTSSASPSVFGTSVTFTATIGGSDTATTPSGTVIFKDGSTVLKTVSLTSSGVVTCETSALSVGPHSISAQYSGDTYYPAATATLTQTVNKASTTTTLTSSANPSTIGQSVTFTAQVSDSSSAANPSGTVAFNDGATAIGTGTLDASGKAVLTIKTLTEGDHDITAVYAGDQTFKGSSSADLIQTVKNSCTRPYLLHICACGGVVTVSPNQCTFAPGTVVTLTAVAKPGYTFVGWDGDLDGTANPATITMNSDKFIQANFTENHPGSGYTLTTGVSGQGSITVSPAQATYTKYSRVTLTAVPAAGYRFYKWQGDLCGDDNPDTILMTENKQVTAVFTTVSPIESYTLTVTVQGSGTVTKNPDQATYAKYSTVKLTAVPAAGYTFYKWQGDLDACDSTAYIRITGNEQVTAIFKAINTSGYTLTTSVVGSGTITKSPDQATYARYATVNLTAVPATGYYFYGWQGGLDGNDSTESIRMTEDKQVTAIFKVNSVSGYTLTVSVSGSGTVTKSPDQATYAKYTNVNLTAVPATGYYFYGWQGDLDGNDSTESIRMSENKNVTAVFKSSSGYTLTISVIGSGTITKSPDQATYTRYTTVNLTAVPAPGNYFYKWQGDLDGNDSTESIRMTENKEVTAVFKALPAATTTLSSSLNPANLGVNVTLTASVNGNSPSGSVTFKDDTTVLSTVVLSFGKALCTTNVLTAGSHSITAVYSGDSRNAGSTSAVLTQVINKVKINTTTTLIAPNGPTATGKAVISARVQPVSGNGTPTGTVSFYNGTTKLADVALTNSVAVLGSSNLPAGSYSIKATYNGDSGYNTSSSSISAAFILYQDCQFVIWGGNPSGVQIGGNFNFWGSQWEKQVKYGNYPWNFSFKGFANNVDNNNNKWSTDPGNSCQPPSSIGKYISVIVARNITKSGSTITGDICQVVLVKVDDPGYYQSNPGHSCNGTIVGVIR